MYSEVGRGTTFKVYLPRIDAVVDAATSMSPSATLRGTETILLVDDDDRVRLATAVILRRSGYHVIDAANANDALVECDSVRGAIHLLLHRRRDAQNERAGAGAAGSSRVVPDIKVLCMYAGYTDDSVVRHGVLEAHFAFLQKPVTPQTLRAKVRAVLDEDDTARRP